MTNPQREALAPLLPCPFCGGALSTKRQNQGPSGGITFLLCGANDDGSDGCGAVVSFRPRLTYRESVTAFNRRTPPPAPSRERCRAIARGVVGESDELDHNLADRIADALHAELARSVEPPGGLVGELRAKVEKWRQYSRAPEIRSESHLAWMQASGAHADELEWLLATHGHGGGGDR